MNMSEPVNQRSQSIDYLQNTPSFQQYHRNRKHRKRKRERENQQQQQTYEQSKKKKQIFIHITHYSTKLNLTDKRYIKFLC